MSIAAELIDAHVIDDAAPVIVRVLFQVQVHQRPNGWYSRGQSWATMELARFYRDRSVKYENKRTKCRIVEVKTVATVVE